MTEKQHEAFWKETTTNAMVRNGSMNLSEFITWLSEDKDDYQEIEI